MGNDARAIANLFETASLGGPECAVGFVIWRVMHRYVRAADRALTGFGITHLQFQTLALAAWLGRSGAPVTQVELSRAGEIAPMQVSHMMKALEAKGWISRPRSSSDVRAKHIEVTEAGLAVLRRALPVMIQVQRDVFGAAGEPGGVLLNSLLQLEG
jgi:MarR family transcriptional regulator, organic hydroperoxide resistance regulator